MRLFIAHLGYYDNEIGIYELHTNLLVVAIDINDAIKKIKEKDIFIKKNMHIDAIQEIESIGGYNVLLVENKTSLSKLINYNYSQIKQFT